MRARRREAGRQFKRDHYVFGVFLIDPCWFNFVSFLLSGFAGTTCGQIPSARRAGPGLALALGMYMKRRSLTFGLWLLAASVPGSLHAQAVNPTTAQFGASADHNATAADGTPAVTRYDLDF